MNTRIPDYLIKYHKKKLALKEFTYSLYGYKHKLSKIIQD